MYWIEAKKFEPPKDEVIAVSKDKIIMLGFIYTFPNDDRMFMSNEHGDVIIVEYYISKPSLLLTLPTK